MCEEYTYQERKHELRYVSVSKPEEKCAGKYGKALISLGQYPQQHPSEQQFLRYRSNNAGVDIRHDFSKYSLSKSFTVN